MSSDQTVTVVVAAKIVVDGKFLLHQITSREHREGLFGKWEFPGGVVRFGEDFESALRREVKEELGLEIHVGELLHAQINTYETGTDYLVLYYACTLLCIPDWEYVTPVKLLSPRELRDYATLPGTVEAIQRDVFSFVENDLRKQPIDDTLRILTYEVGRMNELVHKSRVYGVEAFPEFLLKNQSADALSMLRMFYEHLNWSLDEMMKLGEVRYMDRMGDIGKHGKTSQ